MQLRKLPFLDRRRMSGKRIMVVEDDPSISEVLSGSLIDEGYDVRTVTDGVDALLLAKAWLPSLVILDLRLPRLSGLDVLRKLPLYETPPPRVIVLTADLITPAEELVGADIIFPKPFDLNDLLAEIRCPAAEA